MSRPTETLKETRISNVTFLSFNLADAEMAASKGEKGEKGRRVCIVHTVGPQRWVTARNDLLAWGAGSLLFPLGKECGWAPEPKGEGQAWEIPGVAEILFQAFLPSASSPHTLPASSPTAGITHRPASPRPLSGPAGKIYFTYLPKGPCPGAQDSTPKKGHPEF